MSGELANRNSREELVCLRYSEGLVIENVGARPFVLSGELANRNSREEPVCLRYSEGLVIINSRSSSAYVEGRARPPILKGELVRVSS